MLTKAEKNALIDQMLKSQHELELCQRVADAQRDKDPEVAEAMEAESWVHEHILDLMRELLTDESEGGEDNG